MICVAFLFLCFVKWRDGVRNTRLCDLCGMRIYITKCKQELEFPCKSNVVLSSCGSKDFEKKEANGLKKARSKRFNPLETSSLSLMKKVVSYVVIRQDLGGF